MSNEQGNPTEYYSDAARQVVKGCSNWSDIQYKIVPRIAVLLQERDDAATAMRDLCVEKVKQHSHCHGDASCTLVSELESLTLDHYGRKQK